VYCLSKGQDDKEEMGVGTLLVFANLILKVFIIPSCFRQRKKLTLEVAEQKIPITV
jgi:hypothetical protein